MHTTTFFIFINTVREEATRPAKPRCTCVDWIRTKVLPEYQKETSHDTFDLKHDWVDEFETDWGKWNNVKFQLTNHNVNIGKSTSCGIASEFYKKSDNTNDGCKELQDTSKLSKIGILLSIVALHQKQVPDGENLYHTLMYLFIKKKLKVNGKALGENVYTEQTRCVIEENAKLGMNN